MDFDLNGNVLQLDVFVSSSGDQNIDLNVMLDENGMVDDMQQESDVSDIVVSVVGMEFDSVDEALLFYKVYGFKSGFGVVKRTNHKKEGPCYHYAFACNKWKKPEERDFSQPPLPERKRPLLGTECKAMISISDLNLNNGWVITKVQLEHNHEFSESSDKITTYRQIPLRF